MDCSMNIAIIAPSQIPARRANTIQVMKMAQALSLSGHEVRLAAPADDRRAGSQEDRQWPALARHYGLQREFPIHWLYASPRMRRYDYSLRAVRWARSWEAQAVYTRLPQAAALASTLGLATIFEIHDLPGGRLNPWLLRRFLRGQGARRLVVITQSLAADLGQRFGVPVTPPFTVVAPDGVDLARYARQPSPVEARRLLSQDKGFDPLLRPEQFVAGYSGHLYPGRGSEFLLRLAQRLPEIVFLVAGGEPPEVALLRSEAQSFGLENMILTGFVPNADLPCYQAACDVLLMPYQRKVAASSGGDIARYLSPMKLFEYLACQRAIISSDLPVLQEILNPQNAILLPVDDLEAWAYALENLRADPQLRERLAQQARQDANRYTWEARAEKILEGWPPC
jgi:glycosyltransferase involved in cell wall biosynthesis